MKEFMLINMHGQPGCAGCKLPDQTVIKAEGENPIAAVASKLSGDLLELTQEPTADPLVNNVIGTFDGHAEIKLFATVVEVSSKPQAVLTLNHPDDVSGTTIFNDGTKAFWTEGRNSLVVIIRPDGNPAVLSNVNDCSHPIIQALNDMPAHATRIMNLHELYEHDLTRMDLPHAREVGTI